MVHTREILEDGTRHLPPALVLLHARDRVRAEDGLEAAVIRPAVRLEHEQQQQILLRKATCLLQNLARVRAAPRLEKRFLGEYDVGRLA